MFLVYLLLLFEERLLLPALELPLLLLPLALARSLCALLSWVLALPPLLAAWARLILPADGDDDLEEEEEELRDAMACSFDGLQKAAVAAAAQTPNLGRLRTEAVGVHSACA